MTRYRKIFEPMRIGNVEVKNRIEFSPAIPCLASPDGFVTRELIYCWFIFESKLPHTQE